MHKLRSVAVCLAALGVAYAMGQFDGPAPLAWRWAGSTPIAPAGSPVVDGQNVYVAVGSRIYNLDLATGNKKWQYPLLDPVPGYFRSNPILVGGLVIGAADDMLYGVDAASGEQKWTYKAPGPIVGQPVLAGPYVVMNLRNSELMAVNASDGVAAFQNPERIFAGLQGGLGAHQNDVFYFTQDRVLYRMNVASRQSRKIRQFNQISPDATPTFLGDNLYLNSGAFVVGLTSTGGPRFQQNTSQDLVMGPAVSAEGIAVVSRDGKVVMMDLNGKIKMRTKAGTQTRELAITDLGAGPSSKPTPVGGNFVVGTTNGSIVLVDGETANILWSFVIRPLVRAQNAEGQEIISVAAAGQPVVAGNTLLQLADDGSLLAFDKLNGIDLTGPSVDMFWPAPGAFTPGNNLVLAFLLSDLASGVNEKTIKVTVNGQDMEYEYGRDGRAIVRINGFNKNRPLQDGRATIVVTATDWSGNQSTATYGLQIDNSLPPLAPPPAATTTGGNSGGGGPGLSGSGGRGGG